MDALDYHLLQVRLLNERTAAHKDADGARRHEQRLLRVAEGLRVVIAANPDLFVRSADVTGAAAAAVRILER